jgi:hypothetical protein
MKQALVVNSLPSENASKIGILPCCEEFEKTFLGCSVEMKKALIGYSMELKNNFIQCCEEHEDLRERARA